MTELGNYFFMVWRSLYIKYNKYLTTIYLIIIFLDYHQGICHIHTKIYWDYEELLETHFKRRPFPFATC